MSVTILSAVESQTAPPVAALRPPARGVQASPVSAPGPRRQEAPAQQEPALAEEEPAPLAHATQQELVHAVASAATAPVREAAQPAAKPKRAEPKQEQMQFEPVTRGRFEKSEPTIVDGQDLDVPTFLRRNVKVK
jgi:cell division protein FtsZ